MTKSIVLVSALSVVVMALVSCASDSGDLYPWRINTEPTTPEYHEAAPAHDENIGGAPGWH